MASQRDLESLVRKLNRKILVHWVEEMRLGKPAYEYLVARVRQNNLNRHQTANALHALFRLRSHGNEQEVFTLIREHVCHGESRVRNEAVTLLIGMMRLHKLQPPFDLSPCIDGVKAAIVLGLYRNVESFARDFLTEHGGT